MPQWLTLTPEEHADQGWHRYSNYLFAAEKMFCPVQVMEFAQLLPWYPLVFIKAKNGRFHLAALMGLEPRKNLFVSPQGQWLAPYIPAHFRGYPFGLAAQQGVKFDQDSQLMASAADEGTMPFFTQEGQWSEFMQQIRGFLVQSHKGRLITQKMVEQLAKYDLLVPWPIKWTTHDGREQTQRGYYRCDERRLASLPPDIYRQLVGSGVLGLFYAQLFSQARLFDLQHRYQEYTKLTLLPEPDLSVLFDSDNDVLKF